MLGKLWEIYKNSDKIKKLKVIFNECGFSENCKIVELNFEGYFSKNNYIILSTWGKQFVLFDKEIYSITINDDYVVIEG